MQWGAGCAEQNSHSDEAVSNQADQLNTITMLIFIVEQSLSEKIYCSQTLHFNDGLQALVCLRSPHG